MDELCLDNEELSSRRKAVLFEKSKATFLWKAARGRLPICLSSWPSQRRDTHLLMTIVMFDRFLTIVIK